MMIDGVGQFYLCLTPLLIYPGKHNFAFWVNLSCSWILLRSN